MKNNRSDSRPFLFALILLASICACSSDNRTTYFRISGRQILVRSFPSRFSPLEFQHFIDSVSTLTPPYVTFLTADVTGDGRDDTCLTEASIVNRALFVKHVIYSNGTQIWLDTLNLADIHWSMWDEDDSASYDLLMPYSGLFLSKKYFTNFVGGIVNPQSPEFSYFTHVLHASDMQLWSQRFSSFKGHWIWYLDYSDPGGMIWDKFHGKFILYWGT